MKLVLQFLMRFGRMFAERYLDAKQADAKCWMLGCKSFLDEAQSPKRPRWPRDRQIPNISWNWRQNIRQNRRLGGMKEYQDRRGKRIVFLECAWNRELFNLGLKRYWCAGERQRNLGEYDCKKKGTAEDIRVCFGNAETSLIGCEGMEDGYRGV